jgi:hypothetical protein
MRCFFDSVRAWEQLAALPQQQQQQPPPPSSQDSSSFQEQQHHAALLARAHGPLLAVVLDILLLLLFRIHPDWMRIAPDWKPDWNQKARYVLTLLFWAVRDATPVLDVRGIASVLLPPLLVHPGPALLQAPAAAAPPAAAAAAEAEIGQASDDAQADDDSKPLELLQCLLSKLMLDGEQSAAYCCRFQ